MINQTTMSQNLYISFRDKRGRRRRRRDLFFFLSRMQNSQKKGDQVSLDRDLVVIEVEHCGDGE